MRTDTIFYQIFQTFNTLLFELLNQPFESGYEFISVEVKEKAFRLDGIFFPKSINQLIYFVEVQFQPKSNFYFKFLSEIMLYLNQYEPNNDWKAVPIFSDRSIEPKQINTYHQELISSDRIVRIYLDELKDSESIAMTIIQLITKPEQDALPIVQYLKQQNLESDIVKLIETVLVYKFTNLTRQEIETMFALSDLKKTKVYQEALQEGRQEGKQEGRQEIALNLLKTGMNIAQVAKLTGLTTAQVQQIQG
jgi:predicted transposase/invertase (TIGR01784 family)